MLSGEGSVSEVMGDSEEAIPFTEHSRTLDALFRLCYPIADPSLTTASDLFNVMEASRKYMVDHAWKFCLDALMSPAILDKEPFNVFTITCRYELAKEARSAAKLSLRKDFPPLEDPAGLDWISGRTLFAYLKYRQACTDEVQYRVCNWEYWANTVLAQKSLTISCGTCEPLAMGGTTGEFKLDPDMYYKAALAIFERPSCWIPDDKIMRTLTELIITELDLLKQFPCFSCRERATHEVRQFNAEVVLSDLEDAISRVDLKLPF
ncbi:hypothetical protein CERSUDRAFT_112931 [Gelatoporia subvermispora B]|uniref:BTB domain-containing protein n=1 Tax=Ceriporiopsis subvermispora (strain B) TaxID=914234 RepID=M2QQC7_CERS8|nr:hypothetical protein CERSUDRAFT_112931 [Gelatoporia subvermispora B]